MNGTQTSLGDPSIVRERQYRTRARAAAKHLRRALRVLSQDDKKRLPFTVAEMHAAAEHLQKIGDSPCP